MNEWDLLVTAQDIELGDTLEVSRYGVSEAMILVQVQPRKGILLKSSGNRERWFSTSLEEINGPGYIVGKWPKNLAINEL